MYFIQAVLLNEGQETSEEMAELLTAYTQVTNFAYSGNSAYPQYIHKLR